MEHDKHVRQVQQRLMGFGVYWEAKKCQFAVAEVSFLGFVFTPTGVGMESIRMNTIEVWPTPKSLRDDQSLPEFTNLYRRFIQTYAKVTLPLTESLKKSETYYGKFSGVAAKWEWTREAELSFRKLKRTLTEEPIL